MTAVQQDWVLNLPFQQQSVLFGALRGPDGIGKSHPCKELVRAYRACVIKAATTGQPMNVNTPGDTFMDLRPLLSVFWDALVRKFYYDVDELPHHYVMHLIHAAQIVGVNHPDPSIAVLWTAFYLQGVYDMHLLPEPHFEMDNRLNDFGSSPNGMCGHQ